MSQAFHASIATGLALLFAPAAAFGQPLGTAADAAADATRAAASRPAAAAAATAADAAAAPGGYSLGGGRVAPGSIPTPGTPRQAPASRRLEGALGSALGSILGGSGGQQYEQIFDSALGAAIRGATQSSAARTYQGSPPSEQGLPGTSAPQGRGPQGAGVRWARAPSGADIARYYPDAAMRNRIEGSATVHCSVIANGALTNCAIVSESPIGHDFGDALLKLSKLFRAETAAGDGSGSGRVVPVHVNFRLPIG